MWWFFCIRTFKSAPKGYNQFINVFGYIEKRNFYLPLANILVNTKSYEIYDRIIKEFLNYFVIYNIEINFSNKSIMCDFEKSLRKLKII